MRTYLIILFSLFTFLQVAVGAPVNQDVVEKFKDNELSNGSQFSPQLMSELGARALLTAKIMELNIETLVIEENTAYFMLKNNKDICRQIFINELKYIVHTKCYRDGRELLNFVSIFRK